MSKSNAFESDLLRFIFNNTALDALSATVTNLWISLHTADPGEAGAQNTSEPTYDGYARKSIARTSAGFVVTNNESVFGANLDFDPCTSGSANISWFGVGTTSSGAGYLVYSGSVAPALVVTTGVTPRLTSASKVTED